MRRGDEICVGIAKRRDVKPLVATRIAEIAYRKVDCPRWHTLNDPLPPYENRGGVGDWRYGERHDGRPWTEGDCAHGIAVSVGNVYLHETGDRRMRRYRIL